MERINCTCGRSHDRDIIPVCTGLYKECYATRIDFPDTPVFRDTNSEGTHRLTPEEDEKFRTFSIIDKCGTIAYLCSLLDPMHPHELTDINFHLRAIQNIIYARKTIQHEPATDIQSPQKTSESSLY